ncbi:Ribonuclease J [Candidatus Lokiarchaeum ossiferum]|uniref:Ribonuclease J n=1 Tax=Candidatus Lokiarchaeum ossiferum TaxID=2951803 RepID=A0ABY6HNC9_9ARCH|nr:Ribonuclease J [Candidatus Lokiarchaeum sp. B-35]
MQTKKTILEFFGGVGTIGGNKICLMAANGYGILLDFGYDFSIATKYFDDFMKPRQKQILIDGILIGMLPWPQGSLKGIYRKELCKYNRSQIESNYTYYQKSHPHFTSLNLEDPPKISEVLISHAHSDHISDIRYLDPQIKLIGSSLTIDFLKIFDDLYSSNSLLSNIYSYKPFFITGTNKNGDITRPTKVKGSQINRTLRGFSSSAYIPCAQGGFKVQIFETDHSIPGSAGYLIYDNITGTKIAYSGDIRMHGPERQKSLDFISAAKKFGPDVLIMEGTRVSDNNSEPNLNSEAEVQKSISDLLQEIHKKDPDKMVFFSSSNRDFWRLSSFYAAALSANRKLVVNADTYYILQELNAKGIDFQIDISNVRVFLPRKDWGVYSPLDYSKSPIKKLCEVSASRREEIELEKKRTRVSDFIDLTKDFLIRAEEIHQNPNQFLMFLPYYNFLDLFDLQPPRNSYFILSKSEPWDDEGRIEQSKLEAWLARYDIGSDHIKRYHCSGHASGDEIISIIQTIHPKYVFPVHTTHPELFQKLLDDEIMVILPEYAKKYEI